MDALDQLEKEKVPCWHERGRLAIEQREQRFSKPLNEEAVVRQLRERFW